MHPTLVSKIADSKSVKRNQLLMRVRRGGRSSRLDLSRRARISNSRVCELVDGLLADGRLLEEPVSGTRRGRRGITLQVNPRFGHVVGFDMEALRLRLVVLDFAGNVVWQTRQDMGDIDGRQALIDRVLQFIDDGLKEIRPQFPNLLGIGVAASGVIDLRSGSILHYDLLPEVRDIPLRDLIASRTRLPCAMEDNIRALTLAEWMHGAARHLESFVCLAVRSGIGAGIVINEKLYGGSHGLAGELGYSVIPAASSSGKWKYLQDLISEHALGIDAEQRPLALESARVKYLARLLGSQLATIAALLDPQAIVLSGPILHPDGPFWGAVVRSFGRMALPELAERVQLLPAQLGPFAAAVGAGHRCLQMLYPVESTRKSDGYESLSSAV